MARRSVAAGLGSSTWHSYPGTFAVQVGLSPGTSELSPGTSAVQVGLSPLWPGSHPGSTWDLPGHTPLETPPGHYTAVHQAVLSFRYCTVHYLFPALGVKEGEPMSPDVWQVAAPGVKQVTWCPPGSTLPGKLVGAKVGE